MDGDEVSENATRLNRKGISATRVAVLIALAAASFA
jgi:hypothetical protein